MIELQNGHTYELEQKFSSSDLSNHFEGCEQSLLQEDMAKVGDFVNIPILENGNLHNLCFRRTS